MFSSQKKSVKSANSEIAFFGANKIFLTGVKFILDDVNFLTSINNAQFSVHYLHDGSLIDLLMGLKKMKNSESKIVFCGKKTLYLLKSLNFKTNALILSQYVSAAKFKEELTIWLCRCNHETDYPSDSKYNNLLTPAEWKVINLFCIGLKTEDIAFIENIKTKTVSSHKRNAMNKIFAITNQELYAKFMLLTVLKNPS